VATKFLSTLSGTAFGAAGDEAVSVRVSGDSVPRVRIDAGGKITWGSGSATGDVTLYRSAANALKTDDTLQAVAGVITATTDGAPSAALADGAIAIDTTNDAFYFRSSSTWSQVSGGGGASLSVSDGPPDSPSAGDLWFESDTGRTLVYYADGSSNQWVEIGLASASGASGTDGKIQFSESDSLTSDTLLHWDNTNNRLGIGTTSPATALSVYTTASVGGITLDGSTYPAITLKGAGTIRGYIGIATAATGFSSDAATGDIVVRSDSTKLHLGTGSGAAALTVSGTSVGIGTASPVGKVNIKHDNADGVVDFTDGLVFTNRAGGGADHWTHAGIVSTGSSGFNGNLVFGTDGDSTNNTSGIAERMRVTTDGLCFNGDSASSNALDDYEEGTWSPTYTSTNGDMSGVTVNATFTEGQYQKVGRWVTCTWFIRTDSITTLGTGFALLSGFPFDKSNRGTYTRVAGTAGVIFDFVTRSPEFVWFPDNGSSCYLSYHSGDQNEYGTISTSNLATSANRNGFFGTITYETDD